MCDLVEKILKTIQESVKMGIKATSVQFVTTIGLEMENTDAQNVFLMIFHITL